MQTEKKYPFYWRSAGAWGTKYKEHNFTVFGNGEVLIHHQGERILDRKFTNEREARDFCYTWAHEHLGAPLPA